MQTFLYTLSGTNQPAQITGGGLFSQARFMPYKGFSASGTPVLNNNIVYVGPKSGEQSFPLTTGNPVVIDYATAQAMYDATTNWWAVGSSGDGVYATYL
jgi:hypothetical protein